MEEKITFEQAMEKLDGVVAKLEKGDVTLDEMIALHAEGTKYAAMAEKMLNDYEKKLTKLSAGKGEPK